MRVPFLNRLSHGKEEGIYDPRAQEEAPHLVEKEGGWRTQEGAGDKILLPRH